jgi:hypothetical protein
MGLFNSSKIPQPPLPNLAVYLDDTEDKVYRPNEVVKGHVILTPVASIEPHALQVSLFGQLLVWHRTSGSTDDSSDYYHWRDNAPFFIVTQNILHTATTTAYGDEKEKQPVTSRLEAGQTYRVSFQFTFPARTGKTRAGQYKHDNDQKYTIGLHNLPPTFLLTNRAMPKRKLPPSYPPWSCKQSGGDALDANFAKIEYGIRATLICPCVGVVQGKSLADLTAALTVFFQPTNPTLPFASHTALHRYLKTFTLQCSSLSTNPPEHIGFRQSIRDRFSSSIPKIDFEAALETPDQFTSGTEFRFRASLTTLLRSSNVGHIPPSVTFTVLKLDLLDFTFYRAPRDRDADRSRSGKHRSNKYESWPPPDQGFAVAKLEHEEFTEKKTPLNALPPSATMEFGGLPAYTIMAGSEGKEGSDMQDQTRRCEQWFTARIPCATVPSFRSFAITRAYKIRVGLEVDFGGKKFKMETESLVGRMGSGGV